MKRMRKLLLFLAALQVVNTVSGIVLKSRFLSQHIGEGEINAVAVSGGAEEKVTSPDFRGGYLSRDCPDQTDSSNHVTLWDGSNYKRAA